MLQAAGRGTLTLSLGSRPAAAAWACHQEHVLCEGSSGKPAHFAPIAATGRKDTLEGPNTAEISRTGIQTLKQWCQILSSGGEGGRLGGAGKEDVSRATVGQMITGCFRENKEMGQQAEAGFREAFLRKRLKVFWSRGKELLCGQLLSSIKYIRLGNLGTADDTCQGQSVID